MASGTGIGRHAPREPADALAALDIFKLHRAGGLAVGAITRLRWPHPLAPLAVIVRAEAARVVLAVNGLDEVPVKIEREAVHFGGARPWFECPACARRRRNLYIHGRVACRECFGLAYRSRLQFWPGARALRRALTLRRKLSADPHPFGALPERPLQHMAAKWYDRIVAEIGLCEAEALGALGAMNAALDKPRKGAGNDGQRRQRRRQRRRNDHAR